jgi:hypothetical protein
LRDCLIGTVAQASSERNQGVGLLFKGAIGGSSIVIVFRTDDLEYQVTFQIAGGRIDPMAGERLVSLTRGNALISRLPGSDHANLYYQAENFAIETPLREPNKLSLSRYLDLKANADDVVALAGLLQFARGYHSRAFKIDRLKRYGSETGYAATLDPSAENLWSVLRNLESTRLLDDRYATIMKFMERAFPRSFNGLVIDQSGPNSLYARFLEKQFQTPIYAYHVSDGYIQLLILLTALYSDEIGRSSLLLFDEPETSLHPWALAVLGEAIADAAKNRNKQILLATHSPVLLSQFDPEQIFTVSTSDGQTLLSRLNNVAEIHDLLDKYATGTLYMSELVGGQSQPEIIQPSSQASE